MRKNRKWVIGFAVVLCIVLPLGGLVQARGGVLASLADVVPMMISYQGQVNVSGSPYTGTGYFKFAIVNANGSVSYWSNDGASTAGGPPVLGVPLAVNKGLFNVLLGDVTQAGITQPLSPAVFSAPERYLRVWFSVDGVTYQQLLPDRRFSAVPYALRAQEAVNAETALTAANSDYATSAGMATSASTAVTANYAASAGTAITATNATNAAYALQAGLALSATNATNAAYALDADKVDGLHASELGVPPGGMILGLADDSRLTGIGLTDLGTSNVTFKGKWANINTGGMPGSRHGHAIVWTGTEMIVFGGFTMPMTWGTNTGARYNPTTDTWTSTSTTNAPSLTMAKAVWTGSRMFVVGGYYSGVPCALYDPATDTWASVSSVGMPGNGDYDTYDTMLWTGSEVLLWEPNSSGALYNPTLDTWRPITTTGAPPSNLVGYSSVWTGKYVLIFGGTDYSSNYYNNLYYYNPIANSWGSVSGSSMSNVPSPRGYHSAVWADGEMIVWGGRGPGNVYYSDGGRMSQVGFVWRPLSLSGAPTARSKHSVVWTGVDMVVWGGANSSSTFQTGGRYDLAADRWKPLSFDATFSGRFDASFVWTGDSILFWGMKDSYPAPTDTARRVYLLLNLYEQP